MGTLQPRVPLDADHTHPCPVCISRLILNQLVARSLLIPLFAPPCREEHRNFVLFFQVGLRFPVRLTMLAGFGSKPALLPAHWTEISWRRVQLQRLAEAAQQKTQVPPLSRARCSTGGHGLRRRTNNCSRVWLRWAVQRQTWAKT